MADEKTEKATPQRKREERKKGNIFKSNDLITVFSLVVVFYSLKLLSPLIDNTVESLIEEYFALAAYQKTITDSDVAAFLIDGCRVMALTALPLLVISSLVAIILTMAQTRMLVSSESIKFKLSHLNPISGIKKMFSLRGVVELLKAFAKISILLYIVYGKLRDYFPRFERLMDMEPVQALAVMSEFIMSIVLNCGVIFLFLAILDYIYQWWEYERNLRMSKQEIKEEYKHTEGDPQVKAKIKERQRKQAMSRMMQNVPQADVVIRNPTHFAIAVKYDAEKNRAPLVLAKGADLVAQRIVKVAEENHIMTIENKPLARGLFDAVEVGFEIPEQFYQPVAEVLAFVYSLKEKDKK